MPVTFTCGLSWTRNAPVASLAGDVGVTPIASFAAFAAISGAPCSISVGSVTVPEAVMVAVCPAGTCTQRCFAAPSDQSGERMEYGASDLAVLSVVRLRKI